MPGSFRSKPEDRGAHASGSFRNQDRGAAQSPQSTSRILLQRIHERLDRQSDLLVAMAMALQSLDSELDVRIANAFRSELGKRMAGIEERIAQRIFSREGGRCQQSPECQTRSQSAELSDRYSLRSCDTSGDRDRDVSAENGHGTGQPRMRALNSPQNSTTGTLKHSFLRRFARTDEGKTASGSTQNQAEETNAGRAPGLMTRLLENVFGICEPDPKVGKEGSKVIHPQSNFHTGFPRCRYSD
jgi:hypothetical protein